LAKEPAEDEEETPFERLKDDQRDKVWQEYVWDMLRDQVALRAAEQVFPPEKDYTMQHADHGVLSLVVREQARGRIWSPLPWVARWNPWMWNSRPDSRPVPLSFLTGLTLIAAALGLLYVFLVVLNRDMAA